MRACVIVAVAFGLFGPAGTARAADEYKDLIVGKWEIVYSDAPDTIPVGTKLEFTAAGKVIVTAKDKEGKPRTEGLGGYKVEQNVIVLTGKENTKNDKARIVLLNKSSFIINDEAEDKVMVLKKAK